MHRLTFGVSALETLRQCFAVCITPGEVAGVMQFGRNGLALSANCCVAVAHPGIELRSGFAHAQWKDTQNGAPSLVFDTVLTTIPLQLNLSAIFGGRERGGMAGRIAAVGGLAEAW
jgi:hypothetical protein